MENLLVQICLGLSLSACAGFRAFLPLLAVSILQRTGYIHVGDSFVWIGSTAALIIFSTATVFEIMGDKFPLVDHFLDAAGLIIKPAAGALMVSSIITQMDPMLSLILAVIAGGAVAETVHVQKSSLRAASTGVTAGAANPFLSFMEDVGTVAGVLFSILLPVVAFFVIIIAAYFCFNFVRSYIVKKKENGGNPAPGAKPA